MKKADAIKITVSVAALILAAAILYFSLRSEPPTPVEAAPQTPESIVPPREGGAIAAPKR